MNEVLPKTRRVRRERMIPLADSYFDTLQPNDGAIFTRFHRNCNRVENSVQTTSDPEFTLFPFAKLSCEDQFQLGCYRFDDWVRGRRFPLVDEECALVLTCAFIE